jgi:hypothetical protein
MEARCLPSDCALDEMLLWGIDRIFMFRLLDALARYVLRHGDPTHNPIPFF